VSRDAEFEGRSWALETGRVPRSNPRAPYIGNGRDQVDSIHFTRREFVERGLVIRADAGVDSLASTANMSDTSRRQR